MSFKIVVRHRGKEYQVESVAALDALLNQLEERDRVAAPKVSPHPRAVTLLTTSMETQLLRILERIRLSGKGLEAAEIGEIGGMKDPRGLGSASRGWRRVLARYGFTLDDAMIHARDLGTRLWLPGPKIEAVIKALRDGLK